MPHLLVVEDDPGLRATIGLVLGADGHQVSCAATSIEALTALARSRPDAAIIDAVLPLESGLRLASQAVDLGIPVIIMTAEPATQQQLERFGCPYLTKPLPFDRLLTETNTLLREAEYQLGRMHDLLQRLRANMAGLREAIEAARATVAQIEAERAAEMRRR